MIAEKSFPNDLVTYSIFYNVAKVVAFYICEKDAAV